MKRVTVTSNRGDMESGEYALWDVLWCVNCRENRPVDMLGEAAYLCMVCGTLTDFTDPDRSC